MEEDSVSSLAQQTKWRSKAVLKSTLFCNKINTAMLTPQLPKHPQKVFSKKQVIS